MNREFQWVTDAAGVAELAEVLNANSWHALDSESDSGFAYHERLSLLQFNAGGRLWLVDLVRLQGVSGAIEPLRQALESSEIRTYLHGGEFDVGCLKRDFDIHLGGLWDSQQAASFLGWPKTGYGSVVERICGLQLAKAFSLYDWSKRPIASEAIEYALDDVRYLPNVCQHLEREVETADLVEEVGIANQVVMDALWSGGYTPRDVWRVKGVRRLPRERLGVLMTLLLLRDEIAQQENRPPGRILNDQVLVSLADRAPRKRRELQRCGVRGWFVERFGDALLEAITEGVERPPEVSAPQRRPQIDPRERRYEEQLKAWRRAEAERRSVPFQVVLPSRALQYLKAHPTEDLRSVPQLGPKRIDRYGGELLKLLRS